MSKLIDVSISYHKSNSNIHIHTLIAQEISEPPVVRRKQAYQTQNTYTSTYSCFLQIDHPSEHALSAVRVIHGNMLMGADC